MFLCAPVYFLVVSRVHKRFVTLIYMTILGLVFLIMGNWYLLPYYIVVGIICEAILWRDGWKSKKKMTAAWSVASLLYNGVNLLPIWFFWDTYEAFALSSGMEQSYIDSFVRYYTSPGWLAFIILFTVLGGFLGSLVGGKLVNKHFKKRESSDGPQESCRPGEAVGTGLYDHRHIPDYRYFTDLRSDSRGIHLSGSAAKLAFPALHGSFLRSAWDSVVPDPVPRFPSGGIFGILCADVLEPDAGVSGIMGSDYHAARRAGSLFIPYPHAESCHSGPTGHVPFFPTMKSELRSVWLSMRNRGLTTPIQLAGHPAASCEYVLVPLLLRCLQIADQLSVSAVARGAERPGKRGSYYGKRSDALDGICLALWTGATAVFLFAGGVRI